MPCQMSVGQVGAGDTYSRGASKGKSYWCVGHKSCILGRGGSLYGLCVCVRACMCMCVCLPPVEMLISKRILGVGRCNIIIWYWLLGGVSITTLSKGAYRALCARCARAVRKVGCSPPLGVR